MALFSFVLRDDRKVGEEVGNSDSMSYYSAAVIALCKLYPLTVFAIYFSVGARARFVLMSINAYAVYFILRYFPVSVARYYYLCAAGFTFLWALSSIYSTIGPPGDTPMTNLLVSLLHLSLTGTYAVYPKHGLYIGQILLALAIPFNDPMSIGSDDTYKRLFLLNLVWFTEIFVGKFICHDESVRLHYLFMLCIPLLRLGPVLCHIYTCVILSFRFYYIRKHLEYVKASFWRIVGEVQNKKGTGYEYDTVHVEPVDDDIHPDPPHTEPEEEDGSPKHDQEGPPEAIAKPSEPGPAQRNGNGGRGPAKAAAPAHFSPGPRGRTPSSTSTLAPNTPVAPVAPPVSSSHASSSAIPSGQHIISIGKSTTTASTMNQPTSIPTESIKPAPAMRIVSTTAYDAMRRSMLANSSAKNGSQGGTASSTAPKKSVVFGPVMEHRYEDAEKVTDGDAAPAPVAPVEKKITIVPLDKYY